ncbi:hypothetical protein VTK73DRAFT_2185 [Phialemonium thermophilum]|uniref:Uncharacterized protein n=1 Tax=Phialemonium thermophilum TaxID=223376 RepID=A0ABR3VSF9_9PEZI
MILEVRRNLQPTLGKVPELPYLTDLAGYRNISLPTGLNLQPTLGKVPELPYLYPLGCGAVWLDPFPLQNASTLFHSPTPPIRLPPVSSCTPQSDFPGRGGKPYVGIARWSLVTLPLVTTPSTSYRRQTLPPRLLLWPFSCAAQAPTTPCPRLAGSQFDVGHRPIVSPFVSAPALIGTRATGPSFGSEVSLPERFPLSRRRRFVSPFSNPASRPASQPASQTPLPFSSISWQAPLAIPPWTTAPP